MNMMYFMQHFTGKKSLWKKIQTVAETEIEKELRDYGLIFLSYAQLGKQFIFLYAQKMYWNTYIQGLPPPPPPPLSVIFQKCAEENGWNNCTRVYDTYT